MRAVSATLAFLASAVIGSFALLGLLLGSFRPAQLVVLAISAALIASAVTAIRGGSLWFLRAVWLGVLVAFIASDPPAGLFEGGIIVLPAFGLILTGLISSLFAARRER
jgi:hypothetical protein